MSEAPEFKVAETQIDQEEFGKGYARLDPEDMRSLNLVPGDLIEIKGKKKTVARVGVISDITKLGKKFIQLDSITRENAQVVIGDKVDIKKVPRKTATTVIISPIDPNYPLPNNAELSHFSKILQGMPVIVGDKINIPFFGGKDRYFLIEATSPSGAVIINQQTKFILKTYDNFLKSDKKVSYEDIGGLDKELKLIREMVEFPLRYSSLFEKLGIEAPKGVLLYGPPGVGKTLIARAVANEAGLHFVKINGPEIIHKYYGESEAALREIFEEASNKAPSIIFIDEIDAIAPKRTAVLGDVEKRVVAQLLALMDGMITRGHVIVIGASNIPEMIDPALRRPGRFDREISMSVPSKEGGLSILKIHTRRMPLHKDVDLSYLAQITHGFVGADLESLCKEAGMVALRRLLTKYENNLYNDDFDKLIEQENLTVTMSDFLSAIREIEPSATREFFTEKPTANFSNVGGLHSIKELLISLIEWPNKYPELFQKAKLHPPRGILFTGPSGCGKTLMAKALAGETGLNFISISSPSIFSKWMGESEKLIHEIFKKAKLSAPTILFFDEIDALISNRTGLSDSGVIERVVSQFFTELDNLSDISRVTVLGATNRYDLLDPALLRPGRFDFILTFTFPSEQERLEIFKIYTDDRPISPDVDLKILSQKTEGCLGSHIEFICERATLFALSETIKEHKQYKDLLVTHNHFESALRETLKLKERINIC
jgi:transitional endoplasmic reticulum ATPase